MTARHACPNCGERLSLSRWARTSGHSGDLHTRCNGCGLAIRAYTPWYIRLGLTLAIPTAILAVMHWLHPQGFHPAWFIPILLWMFASIPLGFHWFGCVVADVTQPSD